MSPTNTSASLLQTLREETESLKEIEKLCATGQGEITALETRISQAEQEIERLRSDDATDLAEASRSLSNQTSLIEIAKERLARLRHKLQTDNQSAAEKRNAVLTLVNRANSALRSFRMKKRRDELTEYVAAWISPNADEASLSATITALAQLDKSLRGLGFSSSYEQSDIDYLNENAAEVKEALKAIE